LFGFRYNNNIMVLLPILRHPFSLIIAAPSNSGKSTLAFEIIKHSDQLVSMIPGGKGFDALWILYQSAQPLYDRFQQELRIPVYFLSSDLKQAPDHAQAPAQESTSPRGLVQALETQMKETRTTAPVILIDDGITQDTQQLIRDLFCRLGHHLSVSVMLLCQSLFDSQNPTLRLCHRNTKALIVFGCPRDQTSLRHLVYQMIPDRKKASVMIQAIVRELSIPYNYVLFDFHPECPPDQRVKTNILCERDPYPVCLCYK
jgi:hypothetical protein